MQYQRLNLKSAEGATNVVSIGDFSNIADSVLEKIIIAVLNIYGGKAMSVMLVPEEKGNATNANVYTSDGINILRSFEFVNPLESHVADFVRYIGDRVEQNSGDGSSTAILLTCLFMKDILDKRRSISARCDSIREIQNDTTILSERFEKMMDELLEYVQSMKIQIDELPLESRQLVLKNLILTTSKGNQFLADNLSTIFAELPPVLRGTSIFRREEIETDKIYDVIQPEYDFLLKVYVSRRAFLNHRLNTEIYHKNCDVLILPDVPDDPQIVLDFIEKRNKPNTHLVIVAGMAIPYFDNFIEGAINHKEVTLVSRNATSQTQINNPIDMRTLLAVAGKEYNGVLDMDVMFSNLLLSEVDIRIAYSEMTISYLYKDVNGIHPLFISKESDYYNSHELELRQEIEKLQSKALKSDENRMNLQVFLTTYRKLTCFKMKTILVGGSTTDHFNALDVIADTTMVVSDSMDNGIVFDIVLKMHLCDCINLDLKELVETSYQRLMFALPAVQSTSKFDYSNDDVWRSFDPESTTIPSVIQSFSSIETTLKRIKEVLVPLTKVSSIVVANSVYMEEKK